MILGASGGVGTLAVQFARLRGARVLALTGGKSLERCIELIRRPGRLAYPNRVEPVPEKVYGVEVVAYDAEAGTKEFARLNRAVEQAKLRVPIAGEYPLEDVGQAHQRLAEGHVIGKLVLRIS